jgi:hypothetical protein
LCPQLHNACAILVLRYIKKNWGSITYPLKHKGYCIAIPKSRRKTNTLFEVIYKYHGLNYFGSGYWRGIAYAHNYSIHMLRASHKTFGLHNISFRIWKGIA